MLDLAKALHQQGLPVEFWLAQRTGSLLADVPADLPIRELGGGGVLRSLWPLIRQLKRRRPRVLLSAMTHTNVVALLAAALSAVRLRVVISERAAPRGQFAAESVQIALLLRLLMWWLYPRAAAVVCVSQGVVQELITELRLPAARLCCIPNPVDLPELRTRGAEPLKHVWLRAGGPPVILAVGRLVSQKDFPTLLQAVRVIRQQRPVRLVILGEGPLRQALEAQIRSLALDDAVALPGFCPNPMAWMARVQLVVLSSRSEGLPGVLLQAMACGTPVISTDCPHGPREILENGRWGTLVPVGNPEALAEAILVHLKSASPTPMPDATGRITLRDPSPRCEAYAPEAIWTAYRAMLLP
jgi:glycosyltransferase involved in cell wall biosynthesis